MGKIQKNADAYTDKITSNYHSSSLAKNVNKISTDTRDVYNVGSQTLLLSLAKTWIGLGVIRPAKTDTEDSFLSIPDILKRKPNLTVDSIESRSNVINRFNYGELFSIQMGDYFLPLSQTFTLQAKKKINVSALVDGIDIIQQVRQEAKNINCSLRIALKDSQPNLRIVTRDESSSIETDKMGNEMYGKIIELSTFLENLYTSNSVFEIWNYDINITHGVSHVTMTDYKFIPSVGKGTFIFEFSLIEVQYGENVLTFDLNQITEENNGQITG